MATAEERMRILKMIDDGKISAEEGTSLLSTLNEVRRGVNAPSGGQRMQGAARWLRLRITDLATGKPKASVQIPIALLDAGMKIGANFAPDVDGVDMSTIMEALRAGLMGKIVDVMDERDGEHIEIFVE